MSGFLSHTVIAVITFVILCVQGSVIPNNKNNSLISISFFATDLSGCGIILKCDASVTIMCSSIKSDWKVCDSTKRIWNDNNPKWPEVFTFKHEPGTSQRWRLDLKDNHLIGSTLIASFPILVDEYAQKEGNLLQNEIPNNRGVFWVHRVEVSS